MEANAATGKRPGAARSGRPPRARAGEVEERILDAATRVFLERGFGGASIEEIAETARAGKPTIYARFPGKQALFTAVVARRVQQSTAPETITVTGATIEERLASVATIILRRVLVAESVGLMRAAIAEAQRFPDLASSVHRMARERGTEAIALLVRGLAEADGMGNLPAFAPDRLTATTRRFVDLNLLPMMLRALFGEDLSVLHDEVAPHVASTVAFFLAACRRSGDQAEPERTSR